MRSHRTTAYLPLNIDKKCIEYETPIIKKAKQWLDIYFEGQEPQIKIPLHITGTDFQKEVWHIISKIPYGQTMTYGQIANIIAKKKNIPKMSSHAVGNALGKNQILIIVPCHRIISSSKNLTGYAGGIQRKQKLLELEKRNR